MGGCFRGLDLALWIVCSVWHEVYGLHATSPAGPADYGPSLSVTEVRNARGRRASGYGFDFLSFDAAHNSKRGITVLWSLHLRSFVAAHAFPFLVLMWLRLIVRNGLSLFEVTNVAVPKFASFAASS